MELREARRLTGAVYGTILVLSVIVGFSEDKEAGAQTILASVLVTAFAFWVAHAYSAALAERLADPDARWRALIPRVVAEEWPLVGAALTPSVALLLGAIGVIGRTAAVNIAIVLALGDLFGWGIAVARSAGQPTARAVLTGAVNVGIGLLVVGLKVVVH